MGQLQEEQKHAGPGLASKSKGRAIHSIGQAGGASSGHMPVEINKLMTYLEGLGRKGQIYTRGEWIHILALSYSPQSMF